MARPEFALSRRYGAEQTVPIASNPCRRFARSAIDLVAIGMPVDVFGRRFPSEHNHARTRPHSAHPHRSEPHGAEPFDALSQNVRRQLSAPGQNWRTQLGMARVRYQSMDRGSGWVPRNFQRLSSGRNRIAKRNSSSSCLFAQYCPRVHQHRPLVEQIDAPIGRVGLIGPREEAEDRPSRPVVRKMSPRALHSTGLRRARWVRDP